MHDLRGFWDLVAESPVRTLMLDYDGTLSPFRVDRHMATPYPGVREILDAMLEADCGRVVVVSGRTVKDLIPLLGLKRPPEIWGSHGIERRRPNGKYEVRSLGKHEAYGLRQAHRWTVKDALEQRCEQKPGCLALHWRGLQKEESEDLRQRALEAWTPIASQSNLHLRPFDGGLELRVPDCNKGDAVRTLLSEMGQRVVAAYLGDDQTDEDAFEALKGRGLGVLVREQWRPTKADCWITPPDQLLAFLRQWLQTCQEGVKEKPK
jgi:trehalose-phosphatase